jgi:hypothetical protein
MTNKAPTPTTKPSGGANAQKGTSYMKWAGGGEGHGPEIASPAKTKKNDNGLILLSKVFVMNFEIYIFTGISCIDTQFLT